MGKASNARRRTSRGNPEQLDGPTPEQLAKGNVERETIIHIESYQRASIHRVSGIVERWFAEGHVGFEEPARAAIDWCMERWEARGVIGRQVANYEPVTAYGSNVVRDIELVDELDRVARGFPKAYWDVFENVCRWGEPAGVAGSKLARNTPQAQAAARAIVGMTANMVAMKIGA